MTGTPQTKWLSTAEVLVLTGWSRRKFFYTKPTLTTRVIGNKLEISAASLPASALKHLEPVAPPVKRSAVELNAFAAPAGPLFASKAAEHAGPGRRIALPPQAERQARNDLAILQPLLDFCNAEDRSRFMRLRLRDGSEVRTSNHMAQFIAETHDGTAHAVSVPTLWRWKARFEKDGLVGLARKVREDKGRTKWAEEYPQAAQLAVATFLQPWQTKITAYEAVVRERAKLGIAEEDVPSYKTVCTYLEAVPKAAVVLTREGTQRHNELMSNSLRRGYTDIDANAWWVADTMLHDVLVRDDVFNCDNAAIRPQLTALMDMRSRKIVGYSWALNGSSRSIGSALRMGVRRYGPPINFYCDNGKDFQKVAKFARPANYQQSFEEELSQIDQIGTLRMLGIAAAFCIPFRPQSKPVERFFRTLHLRLDATLPNYTTGNAYKRPEQTDAAAELHKKVLQMNRVEESPLMAMSHFARLAMHWIEQDYNAAHPHSGQGMNGRTPNEVFAACAMTPRPFDLTVLDTLLYERKRCPVRNSGFTANKRRYIGTTMQDEHALYLSNGREVLFCFDGNDQAQGIVTDLDGNKLCDVRAQEFVAQGPAGQPMISEMMQRSAGTRRNTVQSVRQLRKIVSAAGYKTAAQDLNDRALDAEQEPLYLPMAVGDSITQRIVPPAQPTTSNLHSEDIGQSLAARLTQERHGA